MKKKALLIIDMLNDFVHEGAPLEVPQARQVLPAIRLRLDEARAQGTDVVFVCDSHDAHDPEFERMGWPVHAVNGTEGARVVDGLMPRAGETIITKTTYSSFYHTCLEQELRRRAIGLLVLTGCVTNICILYAAAEAVVRGFEVVVPADCVAGIDPHDHGFALRQMRDVLGVRVEE